MAQKVVEQAHFLNHHQMTVQYFDHMSVDLYIVYSQAALPPALRSNEVGLLI